MTNVTGRARAVKDALDAGAQDVGTPSIPGAQPAADATLPPGRAALEISKLLVEVLQVGHVGRRGLVDADAPASVHGDFSADVTVATPSGRGGGPVSSHVIRAAIYIYGHGPQTIGQLAAGLGVSQGWASRVVDEMERAGYVERERDSSDRRVVRVRLVPAAVERVELAYQWRGDAVETALEGMSPEERAVVAMFLRRFVDAVRGSP